MAAPQPVSPPSEALAACLLAEPSKSLLAVDACAWPVLAFPGTSAYDCKTDRSSTTAHHVNVIVCVLLFNPNPQQVPTANNAYGAKTVKLYQIMVVYIYMV